MPILARSSQPVDCGGDGSDLSGPIAFDDAALLERCRKGDVRAFGALVAKYQNRVYNLVFRMCGRHSDAEEMAQETFLKAMENLGQFRGQSSFYTWLFRIAANIAISQRRRRGRVHFGSLCGEDGFESEQAALVTAGIARRRSPGPEAEAMTLELRYRVSRAIEELDDEFRLVVVLRDIEEMDYQQIAEVLDLPVGTIKSRLHRARCILKSRLSDLMK